MRRRSTLLCGDCFVVGTEELSLGPPILNSLCEVCGAEVGNGYHWVTGNEVLNKARRRRAMSWSFKIKCPSCGTDHTAIIGDTARLLGGTLQRCRKCSAEFVVEQRPAYRVRTVSSAEENDKIEE